jgi:protein lifeguard
MHRRVPYNYGLLFLFTIAQSYLISSICSIVESRIVVMTALLTLSLTLSLTIYATAT